MGMDVYAINPNPQVQGSDYFRNNVWYWRPLWAFIQLSCSDILSKEDINGGQYNDGYCITEDKAVAIATRILQMKEDGKVDAYVEEYKAEIEKTSKDSWDRNYPIDSENIEAFANFSMHSGGFCIS